MTLGELIEELKKRNPLGIVRYGFGSGHSDRGDYSNAAFDPVEETTFGAMLTHAEDLLNTEQTGWKGGEYVMHSYVEAHIGEYGTCGEPITSMYFRYWDLCALAGGDVAKGKLDDAGSCAQRCWTASSESKQNHDGTYSDAEAM